MSTFETGIEELRERYNELSHKKTAAETKLEQAEEHLRDLQERAKQDYGTCDLEELRQRLEKMSAENQQKTEDYQKHLDEIDQKLSEIESDQRIPSMTSEEGEDASGANDSSDTDYDPFAEE